MLVVNDCFSGGKNDKQGELFHGPGVNEGLLRLKTAKTVASKSNLPIEKCLFNHIDIENV